MPAPLPARRRLGILAVPLAALALCAATAFAQRPPPHGPIFPRAQPPAPPTFPTPQPLVPSIPTPPPPPPIVPRIPPPALPTPPEPQPSPFAGQPPLGRAMQPVEYNEYTCEKCRNVMQGKTPPRSCSKCNTVFAYIVDEQGNTTVTPAGMLSGVRWARALFVLGPILIGAVGVAIRLLTRGGSSDSPRPRRRRKFKPKPRAEDAPLPVDDLDDEPAPKRKPIRAQTVADAGFEVVEDAPPRKVVKARPADAGFEVVDDDPRSLPRARRRDS